MMLLDVLSVVPVAVLAVLGVVVVLGGDFFVIELMTEPERIGLRNGWRLTLDAPMIRKEAASI